MAAKETPEIGEGANPFDSFQIGDQVRHPKWGVGTILFRTGLGDHAKVIVVFPEEGQKKLALKYAKLKKLQDSRPAAPPEAEVEKDVADLDVAVKAAPKAGADDEDGVELEADEIAVEDAAEDGDDDEDEEIVEIDEDLFGSSDAKPFHGFKKVDDEP